MKTRLFHPGVMFVTTLVILVLAIPFARGHLPKSRSDDVRQRLVLRIS